MVLVKYDNLFFVIRKICTLEYNNLQGYTKYNMSSHIILL